jgi:tripartite-type tricarboxylate transporter receptor subunit TctC
MDFSIRKIAAGLAAALAAAIVSAPGASADAVTDFYKGRQVTWIVSYGAGGSYGAYTQIGARHIGKHLPGNPSVVVQFMPGAGGIKATNYLYNAAAKDGGVLGTVTKDLALEQALRPQNAKYDARKFGWVGSFSDYIAVIAVWSASGVKTIEDARKREVIMATSGRGHQGSQLALLLNQYAGTKFKLVTGYRGAKDMNLAMERGEAQMRISAWSGFKSQQGAWLREGKATILAQGGAARQPDLPNTPLFSELVKDPEGRKVLAIVESGASVGWPALMPPGVPADRLGAMRRAFLDMAKDKAFIAEVTKAKLEVNPKSGEALARVIDDVLSADAKVLARARMIAGIKK